MTKLFMLQGFTRILLTIAIIIAALIPGFIIMYLISPESIPESVSVNINNNDDDADTSIFTTILDIIIILGYIVYIYCLYLFRKLLQLLADQKIFHSETIKRLNQIGKYVIVALLMTDIPGIINAIIIGEGKFRPLFITLDLFILILGLFFLVLAEVFQKAKAIKEENDLTV